MADFELSLSRAKLKAIINAVDFVISHDVPLDELRGEEKEFHEDLYQELLRRYDGRL